ncbi:hypothetical protein [uncultured Acetobacteroides sp.]|uniref:hypothetical protein n=1 Tax=uncultured Acetobacteroides sp. TaxID=1760811 RepID=UPI0029F4A461|nr:hypothetical protein [uncultured Acetobacteroides sp.]
MKLLIEIKDSKVDFILELLKNFSFVKVSPLTKEKAEQMEDLKDSVDYVNEAKAGYKKSRSAKDFLDEL